MTSSNIKKITIGLLSALMLQSAFAKPKKNAPPPPYKPNVLVLFVDDYGWADFKYRKDYSYDNIKKLASESVVFENAYPASPTCSPSRAGLITGQHPARLKLIRHIYDENVVPNVGMDYMTLDTDPARMPSRTYLPNNIPTLGTAALSGGYSTAFFGKWHLGSQEYFPRHKGFQEEHGVTAFGHPKSYYPPYFKEGDVYKDAKKDQFLSDRLADDVVKYLADKKGEKKPFFAFVSFYGVHAPIFGKKEYIQGYKDKGMTQIMAKYAAQIQGVDDAIGRIMKSLKEQGLEDDTVVIFSGDQGPLFECAPMRGCKQNNTALFEGGARVPLFFKMPKNFGKPTESRTVKEVVTTLDVMPTLIWLTNGNPDAWGTLDGDSLSPILTGRTEKLDRNEVYLYRSYESRYIAIRSGDWKFIGSRYGDDLLYDLSKDPSETNNLIDIEKEKAAHMRELVKKFEKEMDCEFSIPADINVKANSI